MRYTLIGLTSAVGLALAAGPVSAQQTAPSEAALEQRLAAMEGELSRLRAELAGLKAEKAPPSAPPQSAQTQPVQATGPALHFGGFLKTNALFSRYDSGDLATGSLGRDFYLPSQIPVGGVSEHSDADFIAKQTRLTVSMDSGSGFSGYVEADFQTTPGGGSERTTNGYNLALRRAYITYGRWLFGQDWTTFQNVAALPESTDFVGPTEGTVFVRQPQVRYTLPLGAGYSLAVALENSETASITPTAATLIENDDDRLPDVTARLSLKKPYGYFAVAVLARQLAVDNGAVGAMASGYGLSLSGKVPFGTKARHDLRFMLTGGEGIGRYVGLNFAPDVVYAGTPGAKTPSATPMPMAKTIQSVR